MEAPRAVRLEALEAMANYDHDQIRKLNQSLPSVSDILRLNGIYTDQFRCPWHRPDHTPSCSNFGDHVYCFACHAVADAAGLLWYFEKKSIGHLLRDAAAAEAAHSQVEVPSPSPATLAAPPPVPLERPWARCRDRARAAPSDSTLFYLANRLGGRADLVQQLIDAGDVGIAGPKDPDWRIAGPARHGLTLVVPLYEVSVGEGEAVPRDLTFRWASAKEPTNGKFRRCKDAARGVPLFFGVLPAALAKADGKTLLIAEGATDYLAVRATGRRNVVGVPGTAAARKTGAEVRAAIEAARGRGVAGPSAITLLFDDDWNGVGAVAAGEFIDALGHDLGIDIRSSVAPRKKLTRSKRTGKRKPDLADRLCEAKGDIAAFAGIESQAKLVVPSRSRWKPALALPPSADGRRRQPPGYVTIPGALLALQKQKEGALATYAILVEDAGCLRESTLSVAQIAERLGTDARSVSRYLERLRLEGEFVEREMLNPGEKVTTYLPKAPGFRHSPSASADPAPIRILAAAVPMIATISPAVFRAYVLLVRQFGQTRDPVPTETMARAAHIPLETVYDQLRRLEREELVIGE
jgi:hypothetical protein